MADALGVSVDTLRHWEQGRNPVSPMVGLALETLERRATMITVTRPSEIPGFVYWNWTVRDLRPAHNGREGVLITVQGIPTETTQGNQRLGRFLWAVQWPSGYEGGIPDDALEVVGPLRSESWRLT